MVTVVIKNPSASSPGDFRTRVRAAGTVGDVKRQLQEDPAPPVGAPVHTHPHHPPTVGPRHHHRPHQRSTFASGRGSTAPSRRPWLQRQVPWGRRRQQRRPCSSMCGRRAQWEGVEEEWQTAAAAAAAGGDAGSAAAADGRAPRSHGPLLLLPPLLHRGGAQVGLQECQEEAGRAGMQQGMWGWGGAAAVEGAPRVRRIQFAIRIDLMLLLKLTLLVYVFGQGGGYRRFFALIAAALFIYL
ncbi:unnamed protein product [Closterium sp. NIES-64]|nr:unnamed protein product [Closterium sp. NIES-64]